MFVLVQPRSRGSHVRSASDGLLWHEGSLDARAVAPAGSVEAFARLDGGHDGLELHDARVLLGAHGVALRKLDLQPLGLSAQTLLTLAHLCAHMAPGGPPNMPEAELRYVA